ncbi:MAG: hypothetical protein ABFR90_06360 [Planctomycetota bacterium]
MDIMFVIQCLIALCIGLPIICFINRWIFKVNESIELQKKILGKIDVLTDSVRENDPVLERKKES